MLLPLSLTNGLNWRVGLALLSFSTFAIAARAQPTPKDQDQTQETQARGYWIDSETGLMWAAKDNGKDVSWKKATKYCRDLRLAGYSDWRLATLSELEGIYDKNTNVPGLARLGGPAKGSDFTWHVKGNLFLTGDQWSSDRRMDDRGHPSGYDWYFDFNEGRSNNEPSGFPYSSTGRRALCVRNTENKGGLN
jgi:hypothetical protein